MTQVALVRAAGLLLGGHAQLDRKAQRRAGWEGGTVVAALLRCDLGGDKRENGARIR